MGSWHHTPPDCLLRAIPGILLSRGTGTQSHLLEGCVQATLLRGKSCSASEQLPLEISYKQGEVAWRRESGFATLWLCLLGQVS